MDNKERNGQNIVDVANGFLEKVGLIAYVENFFQTEAVRRTTHEYYVWYEEKVSELADNGPTEALKSKARELADNENLEDELTTNVKSAFKIHLAETLQHMDAYIAVDSMLQNMLIKVLTEDADGKLIEQVKAISSQIALYMVYNYLSRVYEGYVPQGMPEKLVSFLHEVSGGKALVPIAAIFPDFGESDEDETEDFEEGCWDDEDWDDECDEED